MKNILYTTAVAATLFSCTAGEEKKAVSTAEKPTSQRLHTENNQVFTLDTVVSGKTLKAGSAIIPNAFVMQLEQTTDSVIAHLYADHVFSFRWGNAPAYVLTKDSLVRDINREFLDRATLCDLQLVSITPEAEPMAYFIFEIRIPADPVPYRYELEYRSNGETRLTIRDEE